MPYNASSAHGRWECYSGRWRNPYLPAGGLIALAGLAQNGNFRFVLLKVGFKVDSLHEVVTVIPDGHETFSQGSGNSILAFMMVLSAMMVVPPY